jgi:hypothetical protein
MPSCRPLTIKSSVGRVRRDARHWVEQAIAVDEGKRLLGRKQRHKEVEADGDRKSYCVHSLIRDLIPLRDESTMELGEGRTPPLFVSRPRWSLCFREK